MPVRMPVCGIRAAGVSFSGSPTKQRLAETLARDQLLGACLLPGNLAPLTLLGQAMAFVVAGSIPPAQVAHRAPPAAFAERSSKFIF